VRVPASPARRLSSKRCSKKSKAPRYIYIIYINIYIYLPCTAAVFKALLKEEQGSQIRRERRVPRGQRGSCLEGSSWL